MEQKDYARELAVDLPFGVDKGGFCKEWHRIKPLLSAAQAILAVLLPPAAPVIGAIIGFFDKECRGAQVAGRLAIESPVASIKPSDTCKQLCEEQFDRDVAACNGDRDCIVQAAGRYVICVNACQSRT